MIAVPDSVREYMTRRAVRTTVDHLLGPGADKLPEGLEDWDELRAYHRAVLSAYQVRTEHALFLMDVWDAVWGPELAACAAVGAPVSPENQLDEAWLSPPSPQVVWDERMSFVRGFERAEGSARIFAGVDYRQDTGVQLYFTVWSEADQFSESEGLELPSPWELGEDSQDEWLTGDRAFVPGSSTELDMGPLREAARSALAAL